MFRKDVPWDVKQKKKGRRDVGVPADLIGLSSETPQEARIS